jgi:hypothetical protein
MHEKRNWEIARILREVEERITGAEDFGRLYDINGNDTGYFAIGKRNKTLSISITTSNAAFKD